MPSMVVIEHMPKRERTLPTKHYRVVERAVVEKANGQIKMLKDFRQVKKDLSFSAAWTEMLSEREKLKPSRTLAVPTP